MAPIHPPLRLHIILISSPDLGYLVGYNYWVPQTHEYHHNGEIHHYKTQIKNHIHVDAPSLKTQHSHQLQILHDESTLYMQLTFQTEEGGRGQLPEPRGFG